jgi:hypothetical protein
MSQNSQATEIGDTIDRHLDLTQMVLAALCDCGNTRGKNATLSVRYGT